MKKKYFIWVIIACLSFGCRESHIHSHNEEDDHGHDHELEEKELAEEKHEGEIIFDKALAEVAGLQVERIKATDFTGGIKAGGQILTAQGEESVLVATIPGIVDFGKNNFIEGAAVRKGQMLLNLISGHLSEGNTALKVRNAYETAKREFDRQKQLVEDRIVSLREYEQTKLEYEQAKVAWEAIAGKQTGNGVSVVAPMNGFLKEIRVRAGDFVSVGEPLAVISQNNRLILKVDVPEKYYHLLASVRSANFRTPYDDRVYELSQMNGRLLTYGKNSNSTSSYLPVTFEFDNKVAVLPGAFVEVFLLTAPLPDVISLPVSALVEEQGVFSVFVRVHEDAYKKVPVQIGNNNGLSVRILRGINPGDEVVTEGAYQIKLASAASAIPAHSHSH